MEQLKSVKHEVQVRGPEGEQKHWDEKGKLISGKAKTEFIGYRKYMRELEDEAGLIDAAFEEVVDELKREAVFWGDAVMLPPKTG